MAFYQRVVDYVRGSYQEMRRVVWPTRQQTVQHTLLVIFFSLVVALFLGALDFLFSQGFQKLLELR